MPTPIEKAELAGEIRASIEEAIAQLAASQAYRVYRGKLQERLEELLAERTRGMACITTSSGTAAIEIALRAAGIGTGDEVILSAYDYPGNFWAVERVGAFPVLVDIAPDGWQIDLKALQETLPQSPKCKAIIASHLHGQLQNSQAIRQLCDQSGLLFVEDCCQAIGARIEDNPVGAVGHAAVYSFGGGKLISAGRGGGLITHEAALTQRARLAAGAGSGPYAMSELQAAVVLAQLPHLDSMNRLCCQYFSELARQLGEKQTESGSRWLMPQVQELAAESTSVYQAGCLLQPDSGQRADCGPSQNPHSDAALRHSNSADTSPAENCLQQIIGRISPERKQLIGTGFPGFHRRTARRCRRASPLRNAARVSGSTLVLHHRLALESDFSAGDLAAVLSASCEPC